MLRGVHFLVTPSPAIQTMPRLFSPRRFVRIERGIDVATMLGELSEHPGAWNTDVQRQSNVAVQRETVSLTICAHPSPISFREARQRHPITYVGRPTAVAAEFPRTLEFVHRLARRFYGVPGRAVVVRLPPRGRVYEHIDRGLYYQLRSRYHLVLKSVAGSRLRAGPEEVRMLEGELWWFDNRLPHEASNDSDEDRIHLIVDILSPESVAALPLRILASPQRAIRTLRGLFARSGSES
jgi:Aspartyl/Asparaginyl beta-hydroxylase